MNNIPTPETDAALALANDPDGAAEVCTLCENLERRLTAEKARAEAMGQLAHGAACESAELRIKLTVAREALKKIQHNPGNMDMEVGFLSGHIATAALNQTAPKP